MRTLTRILSVILMVALCLSAIAAPASADAGIVIPCDTVNGNTPKCKFNNSKFCNVEFVNDDTSKPANAVLWQFTADNKSGQQVRVRQTQEEICKLYGNEGDDVIEDGETKTVTYDCIGSRNDRTAIRYLANYITLNGAEIPLENKNVTFTNLYCSE